MQYFSARADNIRPYIHDRKQSDKLKFEVLKRGSSYV